MNGVTEFADRAATLEVIDDLEAINQLYRDRSWGDGFPIVPPTPERVERMLAYTSRDRYEVVARIAPGYGAATVERIAINGVLAGCAPQYLPVLIIATEASVAPVFNLQGMQTTTNPVAVWVILNGPLAKTLGVNSGLNCLGQGTWANATIGRAFHLVLQNIGGAVPGEMDRATHGQPAKFSFCCAENEEETPWDALHVERGFSSTQSTVTVVGAEGTINMNSHAKDASELLHAIAGTMMHPPSNEYVHGGEPWIILSPEHAEILHRAGMSKSHVKEQLWTLSRMPARSFTGKELERARRSRESELGPFTPDTLLPISKSAKEIMILVSGGAGTHSVYVPCFGNSRAVTREITVVGQLT